MRIRILDRKARAAIKKLPAFRSLERTKLRIEKRYLAGKISRRQAMDLKSILRSRKCRLLHREVYRLLKLPAQKTLSSSKLSIQQEDSLKHVLGVNRRYGVRVNAEAVAQLIVMQPGWNGTTAEEKVITKLLKAAQS